MVLGTSTSHLLGETVDDHQAEEVDRLARLYTDPYIGNVTRYMQDMTVQERKYLQTIAAGFARRPKPAETATVMTASQRTSL